MKNNLKFALRNSFAAIFFIFFNSCINNIQPIVELPLPPTSGDIPIAISAQILQINVQTRITNNVFEENDAIGLYVLAQPQTMEGARYIENMRFVYSADGFVPDNEIFYPKGEGKCDFISYYPYQEEGVEKNSNNIHISVKANQNLTSNYSLSDFMVTKTTGIIPNKKAVNLKYNHKLSQINIILQIRGDDNIDDLKNDASISINNLSTNAVYNMDTELFSSLTNSQSIIPNGEWEVDEDSHRLTGKKAILIPQPSNGCELILRTQKKVYTAKLPKDLNLECGSSCELSLVYDSRVGIGKITSSISEWKQGGSSNATLEEKENNNSIHIADLNFDETGIYNIVDSTNAIIGEICKEYLLNDDIDAQAIVLYPADHKESGIVLQILGEDEELHGGNISWDKVNNSLTYITGNKTPIEDIYANKEGKIIFEKSDEMQQIEAIECLLTDVRGSEIITYPIVKIGTQYWMRENLNTAKYSDEATIINNSAKLDKTTAGYYLQNSNRFYNQAAIATGKMAPQGWKIPGTDEWEKLKEYIKDNAATMKTGVWTSSEGVPQANNKTGFNGKPVGIYSKTKDKNAISYGFSQRYASYWTVNGNQTTPNEKSFALSNILQTTGKVTNSEYCAYSIRCIKE